MTDKTLAHSPSAHTQRGTAEDCSRRPLFVVFDLDGTLALTDHRAHFLEREKKDWRGF